MYQGKLGGIEFLLAPNETSNTEKGLEGVHQFHIKIHDIKKFNLLSKGKGFDLISCDFGEGKEQYLIRDPHGHPWIFS